MDRAVQDGRCGVKIISLKEARARGLQRYFSGKECSHGHLSERNVSSNICLECHRARAENRRRKNGVNPRSAAISKDERNRRIKERLKKIKRKWRERWATTNKKNAETRRIAFASGQIRYFTGKPCKRGHVAERMTSSGQCMFCSVELQREDRRKNPEKYKEYDRIAHERNPEKKRSYSRKYRFKNREKINDRLNKYYRKNAAALRILKEAAKNDPKLKQLMGEINDALGG